MWLVGVVVRRYIDILSVILNFPYSSCIRSFLAAASLLLCSFLKCFFGLYIYILVWGVRYDGAGVCQYEGIYISMGCEI